jgi:hypothetical protein
VGCEPLQLDESNASIMHLRYFNKDAVVYWLYLQIFDVNAIDDQLLASLKFVVPFLPFLVGTQKGQFILIRNMK